VVVETLDSVPVTDARIPLDAELRTALETEGVPKDELDSGIRTIAANALQHCSAIHREAWNIHQIASSDFSRSEIQSMHPAEKTLWLTLLSKHLRLFSTELAAISSDLAPLFSRDKAPPAETINTRDVHNLDDLNVATKTLYDDGARLDRLLTPTLTLSPSSLPINHSAVPIEQLLAALRTQESRLHVTIERLQTFGQTDRIE
jgi:hypothetical protein